MIHSDKISRIAGLLRQLSVTTGASRSNELSDAIGALRYEIAEQDIMPSDLDDLAVRILAGACMFFEVDESEFSVRHDAQVVRMIGWFCNLSGGGVDAHAFLVALGIIADEKTGRRECSWLPKGVDPDDWRLFAKASMPLSVPVRLAA